MGADRLVIESGGTRLALDTSYVAGIVEVDRVRFMPGRAGFVSGVISLRGEPVAVVDITKAFDGMASAFKPGGPRKIIVLSEKGRSLGFDIGGANIFFLWAEEIAGRPVKDERGRFTSGYMEIAGPIYMADWQELFNEASRILTTAGANV